ncbi:glutamate--cysteine ligase [Schaalia sp. lx-100]|uniref:glutamate--cysteine ligase n=1 Tax=Schaalia sp. lx-100 TaxID=2899081 RepID=UPI001E2D96DC|nr:glutamate--cysteine ligase [Schaalia sp. lx-100]MCD4557589.1 glutamate--cysteine ligase [Schaalia sp. lx-100]
MEFAHSPQSSIGIEWELQLIDQDSNDLRQSAAYIVDRVAGKPFIQSEMLLNTVEVTSGVHRHVAGCVGDLRTGLEILSDITDELRIELASAGSHPFANPAYQRVTDKERYTELVERTQYWGRQMLIFGTHVHVGIDQREKVLPLLKAVLTRAYHIQALSASSPFWSRTDTGYASNRSMFFQQLPTAGVPLQFDRWEELEHFAQGMQQASTIRHFNEVRWDVRPAPGWGTLEIRVADANTNMAELSYIAALIHCLVDFYSNEYEAGRDLPSVPSWFVSENKWRSARYGMDAVLIIDEHGNEEPVKDTLRQLIVQLEPTAEKLGCLNELAGTLEIIREGAAYERLRQVAQLNSGSLDAVVSHMCAEMQAERPLKARELSAGSTGRSLRGKSETTMR